MSDLLWPGDDRAGDHFTSASFLAAMVRVEAVWLEVLGVASPGLPELGASDLERLAREAEVGGNPVIGLVAVLRAALDGADAGLDAGPDAGAAARWLHRGLTSQDVVDSALMIMLSSAVTAVLGDLRTQATTLAALAADHRGTAMVGRTLTQHAVPTTFGLKVATWLTGVLDAHDDVAALRFPVQLGGAAGTLSALVELDRDVDAARTGLADGLGLTLALPWHTTRRPVTRAGDALVACTDAWARIADDVLTLSRPEIGELSEGTGGGSSTMPHKANPVQAVLLRRTALSTPQLAATLHLAAADQADERAVGGWHAEWGTLQVLVRRTVAAGSQCAALLAALRVHPDRMAATLAGARHDVLAEQRTMAGLAGHDPYPDYLGASSAIIDAVLRRAQETLR